MVLQLQAINASHNLWKSLLNLVIIFSVPEKYQIALDQRMVALRRQAKKN